MEPKKRRRRHKYTLMIFSDSMDEEGVKQVYLGSKRVQVLTVLLVVLLIADICYCVYNPILLSGARNRSSAQSEQIKQLMEENETLKAENQELTDKVAILSETINQKVKTEEEKAAEFAELSLPTGFPLTGAATIHESVTEEQIAEEDGEQQKEQEPIMVFKGSAGNMVIASGNGTVEAVLPDTQYGNQVIIDHGNGYRSIYRNTGEVVVKAGDEVVRGATIFVIGEENTELGYQITKDEVYINPEEMVEING